MTGLPHAAVPSLIRDPGRLVYSHAIVGRSRDAAVAVQGVTLFAAGYLFELVIVLAEEHPLTQRQGRWRDVSNALHRRSSDGSFVLRVRHPNGGWAQLGAPIRGAGVEIDVGTVWASGRRLECFTWVSPRPPSGVVRLSVAWSPVGRGEHYVDLELESQAGIGLRAECSGV